MQCSMPLYIGRVLHTLCKISPLSYRKDLVCPMQTFTTIVYEGYLHTLLKVFYCLLADINDYSPA